MTRRKKLILAEFVVTVWEDHIEWGGIESLVWRLLHAKPASGFMPHIRKVYGPRGLRPARSK